MFVRHRRLRKSAAIRDMVRETVLTPMDFIYPLFVVEGENIKREISSLPGNYHLSVDRLSDLIEEVQQAGVRSVLLFGLPALKDNVGSGAWAEDGVVQRAVRTIKNISPELWVMTDVCMCQYTDHGHCGIIKDGDVDNDVSLEYIARIALSHAHAGADMVAPSDMMDGRIAAVRKLLDDYGLTDVSIMSYSAKYSSAFYGPFRAAADSAPQFGDRKAYQIDSANLRQAMSEIEADIDEGADCIIIKPALAYMDVIRRARDRYDLPIAAYSVSGEFAMIKAAAQKGWINEQQATMEILTSLKRAGTDMIITYYALDACHWLKQG
ncbi:porphobilinogen synthase [candidate division KSB3 bacterium]|uniref:Delta-aminolevulinic acid dehydratase n=1 Tax=candidate division KSB3 bacterium TaxID=2044937 RepID=A0A2G6E259_9BACT|nr:MAG: porphobilinogen synthase [candidate division KSB3 bacterium]PIE28757.1 MAG: porphobilinogen synthase [candidate division KSB3 bacterium]